MPTMESRGTLPTHQKGNTTPGELQTPGNAASRASFTSSEKVKASRSSQPQAEAETPGVSQDEFEALERRVDRMQVAIDTIDTKIDAMLAKVEDMDEDRQKHHELVDNLLDAISEADDPCKLLKRQQIRRILQQHLDHAGVSDVNMMPGRGVSDHDCGDGLRKRKKFQSFAPQQL